MLTVIGMCTKVGRALECWKGGEKPQKGTKLATFSGDKYGDKYSRDKITHKQTRLRRATFFVPTLSDLGVDEWNTILTNARKYLLESKKKPRASSSCSSVPTLSEENEAEDPDANFIIPR
jgi:hypothetical protein